MNHKNHVKIMSIMLLLSSSPTGLTKSKMRPKVVSLFSGAGGLSRGFSDRFSIEIAVDNDRYAAATFKANFPMTKVICDDIDNIDWCKELAEIDLKTNDIDVVIGGPPCQGFSKGNRQTNGLNNPLNILWKSYFKVVRTLQPSWFVMENVQGLWFIDNGKTRNEILHVFEEIGYHVETAHLMATDFGVPQSRLRTFFVGNREGFMFPFPKPRCAKDKYTTVGEAILGDLPSLESPDGKIIEGDFWKSDYAGSPRSQYQDIIRCGCSEVTNHVTVKSSEEVRKRWKDIPPGGNWSDITTKNREGWRNVSDEELYKVSHSNLYKRLDPNKPSITIANFRRSMICHPLEDRIISIREAARLQSFPDDYIFIGSKGAQQQMVANAVPPLLGRAIAQQLYYVIRGWIHVERFGSSPIQLKLSTYDNVSVIENAVENTRNIARK
jgi:DNA (cytosine-5)-methyltransferase 1